MAHAQPTLCSKEILSPLYLEALRAYPKVRNLAADPTASAVLLAIAGIGGHLKCNGKPGWRVLARGYQELDAFARGFQAALATRGLLEI